MSSSLVTVQILFLKLGVSNISQETCLEAKDTLENTLALNSF